MEHIMQFRHPAHTRLIVKKLCLIVGVLYLSLNTCACKKEIYTEETFGYEFSGRSVSTTLRELGEYGFVAYEEGIIYCTNHVVKILDYNANKTKVLCSDPGCRHKDSSCSAWIGDDYSGGFAAYCDDCYYYVLSNNKTGYLELKSLSSDWDNQRTIYRFNHSNYSDGAKIYNIKTVYYIVGGTAIIEAEYGNVYAAKTSSSLYEPVEYKTIIIVLDLKSERILDEIENYSIHSVSGNTVVLSRVCWSEELVSKDSFEIDNTFDSYEDYMNWYYLNCSRYYETAVYDLLTQDFFVLLSEEFDRYIDTYGITQHISTYYVLGTDGDSLFISRQNNSNRGEDIYAINIRTSDIKKIYHITNGAVLTVGIADLNSLIDSHHLHFVVYDSEKKYGDVYILDLKTGIEKYIYKDVWNIEYRILSETKDSFVVNTSDGQYFKIFKNDYYAGDFSKKKSFSF